MSKIKETAEVLRNECIATGIYSTVIKTDIALTAKPGQFISVYTKNDSKLLPRPISICEINKEEKTLRIVYRVVGYGTDEFSKYHSGDSITVLGPLGNGFPELDEKAIIIGGGIGIPPMLQLSKTLNCEKSIVLGYRDELFLNDQFEAYGDVYIATEDGSAGTKGNVIDAIKACGVEGKVIYACGPMPMLRGIKKYAEENGIKAYISLEERMACGVGACLGCVCKTKKIDDHSKVNNARICADGPVFDADDVDI